MKATTSKLHHYHDFREKLTQSTLRPTLLRYVQWRREVRAARRAGRPAPPFPDRIGPISINLDLTTACNYACGHCIDWEALNGKDRHSDEGLRQSLRELAARGLRSVILIGGGEPTIHPAFEDLVVFLKRDLRVQVAVVTNGSRNERLTAIAPLLTRGDWVRLSLDSASEGTFQAMHRPRKAILLRDILRSATEIKRANPEVVLGYSFVITWRGARRADESLVENLDEMAEAARLARAHGFDYISFKPFLDRAPDGAEVLRAAPESTSEFPAKEDSPSAVHAAALSRIRAQLAAAEAQSAGDGFRVIRSSNLRVLLDGSWRNWTRQPHECHMQALRQVLSPLGVFNCPAHRGVSKARLGDRDLWNTTGAASATAAMLDSFDAAKECEEVTCLYHPVNHWIEELIEGAEDPARAIPEASAPGDAFL